jgi:hypothetical protein
LDVLIRNSPESELVLQSPREELVTTFNSDHH